MYSLNRRKFIKQSGLATGAYMYIPNFLTRVQPSDIVRTAHIGLGGMGRQHVKWFAGLEEVKIVALCDVDSKQLDKAKMTLKEAGQSESPDIYRDFRNITDRTDIDAISCATPDHWHAGVAIKAFESGKDVYGEKPLSYTIREGQMMLESLEKHSRIFQLGTQIHAGENYHRVVEIIRSGQLGQIKTVKLWKTGGPPIFNKLSTGNPPSTLNWDMWQGPAPSRQYATERCHFNYRYFMDYSGGVFADFWCHIADVVFWALNPSGLKNINAKGKQSDGYGDTPEWLKIDYLFDDLDIQWTTTPPQDVSGAKDMSIGAHFVGTNGTLTCDYGSCQIRIGNETLDDLAEVPKNIPRSSGHQGNFIEAVKSRKQPQSNLAYARQMTLPMHLGLISWQLGRALEWDAKKERFIGDRKANKLLDRKGRKPWRKL